MKMAGGEKGPTKESLTMPAYGEPDKELVTLTEKLFLFSYLLGMDHVSAPLDLAEGDVPAIPFQEAVDFMKGRVSLTKAEWEELEEKVRFRAFTVAALSEPDAIEKVRLKVLQALDDGLPFEQFWEESSALKKAGLFQESPWYWETVYRTNVQTAYNAGRADQIMRSNPRYLEFIGIEDVRQTTICSQRSGVILPAAHEFWKTSWPPLHFNCRSTVRAVSQEEVEVLAEAGEIIEPTLPKDLPSKKPSKGFGGNPLDNGSYYMLTKAMFERGLKYGIINKLNALGNIVMDFDQKWPEYTRETVGKGWIDVHKAARKENEYAENRVVAEILAKDGAHVKMLPIHQGDGWKSPDALIDGVVWEFKSPAKPTKSSVDHCIRDAKKQARNIYLNITVPISHDDLRRGIKGRVSQSEDLNVLAFYYQGKGYRFTKNEIDRSDWDF